MKIIRLLPSQETGYHLFHEKLQRLQAEIRDFVILSLKDNGGDPNQPWKFDPTTLEWRLPEDGIIEQEGNNGR